MVSNRPLILPFPRIFQPGNACYVDNGDVRRIYEVGMKTHVYGLGCLL